MAKHSYYAIHAGGQKHIFRTWEECKAFRDKHPNGARYKGFDSEWAAQDFLDAETAAKVSANDWYAYATSKAGVRAIAYTDGSYDPHRSVYGYGAVVFDAADPTREYRFQGNGTKFSDARNVAGEIDGVLRAVREAVALGYKELVVFHDYEGLGKWADMTWKARKPVAQRYVEQIFQQKQRIKLTFCWVRGHTNVQFNELADKLAGEAAFGPVPFPQGRG